MATTPERDRLLANSTPLAEAEATEEITFKLRTATIRTLVSVHKCPRGFRSRLGYHARLFVTERDGIEREIGYIIGWRISKPTGNKPNIDNRYYLDDWYYRNIREEYDKDSWALAYCFNAIYRPGSFEGDNYDQVVDEEKKNELRDGGNEVVFIQTIYIKWREDPDDEESENTGYGLAPIYLETYYRLLGDKILPAWFALRGPVTYLLIPYLHPEFPVNEQWRHQQQVDGVTDKELIQSVKTELNRAFTNGNYKYETYVDNGKVFTTLVTVLGRVVETEDTISDLADRLLLPAAA